jgi:hypothetical protein
MKRTTVYYLGGAALIFFVLVKLKKNLPSLGIGRSNRPSSVYTGQPRLIEFDGLHPKHRVLFVSNPPEEKRDYSAPLTFWNPPPGHFGSPNILSEPQTYYFETSNLLEPLF